MSEDFDPQADWLVGHWLFFDPVFPEMLERPDEEIIRSAWDEFAVLLEEKGLAELQTVEEHLTGVARAITFHMGLTQRTILGCKAGDESDGDFDLEKLSSQERTHLRELAEWMGRDETQARISRIQRATDWQLLVYAGGTSQGKSVDDTGEARASTEAPAGYGMDEALADRVRLARLYRLTDLRFSVLQNVMFYNTAFGITTRWSDLSSEAKRAVVKQATGRGRPEGTDKFPQEALDLLRVILDFTGDLEEGEQAFFRTTKQDRDSLCKAVGEEMKLSQSGAATRIEAVFRQVNERCSASLPQAQRNVSFYVEHHEHIEEAAKAVKRELLLDGKRHT